MRGCVTGLFVVLLAIALLIGAGYVLLGQAPGGVASTPAPVSSAAARHFDQQVATAAYATGPVTLEITDQEATSKLAEVLAQRTGGPNLDNPQVAFRAGKVYLSGTTRDTPVPVNVLVTGRIEARDGQLVTVVENVDTGRLPLPGSVKEQIAREVTDANALNQYLTFYVTDVQTLDGRLVVRGRPK